MESQQQDKKRSKCGQQARCQKYDLIEKLFHSGHRCRRDTCLDITLKEPEGPGIRLLMCNHTQKINTFCKTHTTPSNEWNDQCHWKEIFVAKFLLETAIFVTLFNKIIMLYLDKPNP
jgi:hypothetical protein